MTNQAEVRRVVGRILEELFPLIAVPVALLLGALVLVALKANPLEAYGALFTGAFGNVSGLTQTMVKATPLLLVALGVVIAFRGGVMLTSAARGSSSSARWLRQPWLSPSGVGPAGCFCRSACWWARWEARCGEESRGY